MTQENYVATDEFSTEALSVKSDPDKLNAFIAKNTKFIKQCAYKAVNKFITESDDEYSVALNAFHEAIRSYDNSKGAFSSFAQTVIKRRLCDYLQTQYRHRPEISVEPYIMEGEIDEDIESPLAFELREKSAELSQEGNYSISSSATLKDEIEALGQLLHPYGFSFMDLASCSPHSAKTKLACKRAVNALMNSVELINKMNKSKSLPMKELTEICGISRKILDRHRRYIIAATLILSGEYPLLAEYMAYIKDTLKEK